MKTKISSFLIALVLTLPVYAQKGPDLMKKAKKAHLAFTLDNGNKLKLTEARDAIDLAIKDPEITAEAKVWLVRGSIYNEIVAQRSTIRQLGIGDMSQLPDVKYPALEAAQAYLKAKSYAKKKYESKDAINGIRAAQNHLYDEGIYAYDQRDYRGAYTHFNETIELHKVLKASGEGSLLDRQGSLEDQQYIAGLAALNAQMNAEAQQKFGDLYRKKYEKPAIYEALYKMASMDENADLNNAYKYLKEGRDLFPEDPSLLFAEINHFLRTNQLDELVSKIKSAIEMEPENVSLYNTLGNVYDNLYQREAEGGDPDMVNLYFNDALNYYKQALGKDPNNVMSNYSIGALYYNKAALSTKELMAMSDDYSEAGLKKYEEKKTEIMEIFDTSLPYFQKAESLDPNEISTLIALKEIYARKDDLQKSNIFKDRLEVVQGGGRNETSYFSN